MQKQNYANNFDDQLATPKYESARNFPPQFAISPILNALRDSKSIACNASTTDRTSEVPSSGTPIDKSFFSSTVIPEVGLAKARKLGSQFRHRQILLIAIFPPKATSPDSPIDENRVKEIVSEMEQLKLKHECMSIENSVLRHIIAKKEESQTALERKVELLLKQNEELRTARCRCKECRKAKTDSFDRREGKVFNELNIDVQPQVEETDAQVSDSEVEISKTKGSWNKESSNLPVASRIAVGFYCKAEISDHDTKTIASIGLAESGISSKCKLPLFHNTQYTSTPTLIRRIRQKCHSDEISEKKASTKDEVKGTGNTTHGEIPMTASTLRSHVRLKRRSNVVSEKEVSVKDKKSEASPTIKRVGISIDEEITNATSGLTKAIHSDIVTDRGIDPINNSLEFFEQDVCFLGQSCQNRQTELGNRYQLEQSITAQEMETFELFSATMGSVSTITWEDTEESQ
ncbi:hypothetical protein TTRE_0000245201 [Trichuris trichiura]|uniref:Uncharacterized protein n=1 Tax=Trichuris trichiura TaxID=36087 RepID=A0A077Z177_TRITR|nr:hypothetical protein TTRE_0000245201 [Trichuris trichiura]